MERDLQGPQGATVEQTDSTRQTFNYGTGGVPWYLLLVYLSFLVFFTWYTLEFQLPDFLDDGPAAETQSYSDSQAE